MLFIIGLVVILSLACQTLSGGNTPAPTLPPPLPTTAAEVPTTVPVPTKAPTEAPQPTAVPTIAVKEFFTEEFETELFFDQWYYFITGPGSDNEDELKMEQEGDGLTVDLGELDMYFYYIYDLQEYEDVRITMVAENLGRNNNNVSLVCRLDFDNDQWYEFSVESGGVWYLYAFDDGYNFLDSGGTTALKQGQAINEYGLECNGETITMYINGDKLKSYPERVYNFREGQVGFNISSLNVLPITVSVKSFDIARP